MKTMISEVSTYLAAAAGLMALTFSWQANTPKILIYDRDAIAGQIEPYVAGGLEPLGIIDQAIAEATERGFFVIDSELNVRGPKSAIFELADFVAVPAPKLSDSTNQ